MPFGKSGRKQGEPNPGPCSSSVSGALETSGPAPAPTSNLDQTHLLLCRRIINKVNDTYGMSLEGIFGPVLEPERAREIFDAWLVRNGLFKDRANSACPELEFSTNTLCSAKMITTGPRRVIFGVGQK